MNYVKITTTIYILRVSNKRFTYFSRLLPILGHYRYYVRLNVNINVINTVRDQDDEYFEWASRLLLNGYGSHVGLFRSYKARSLSK